MKIVKVETVTTVAFGSFREMFEFAVKHQDGVMNRNGDVLAALPATGKHDFCLRNPGSCQCTGLVCMAEGILNDYSNVDEESLARHWNLEVFTGEVREMVDSF